MGMASVLYALKVHNFTMALDIADFKGIVSGDRDWLEWAVNERSKELWIPGAYFLMLFDAI